MRRLGADLAGAWRHPGTRLGLWSHFTTQFTGTVFALMWGFPFLIAGEGLDRETASSLRTPPGRRSTSRGSTSVLRTSGEG